VPASNPPPGLPGAHAHRVIFIDLARALAAVFMVYGHAIDALLAPEYKTGLWHDAWQFQRGLTSALFLMLSGFAFSVATGRHWTSHTRMSASW
jgi:acyltransferase